MTLNQLRVFRAVASTRNIAAAAKSLFMTQPSVSMQLRALEKDLRVPLYERRQGQVILTDAGRILMRYAETILEAAEEADKEIAALRGALRGRLRLGTNITGGMYVLPTIIRRYREQLREVEVSLAIDSSPRIMDSIVQGIVDIGLIGGPVDRSRFEVQNVGRDELELIASPFHEFAKRGVISLGDLAAQTLIVPGIGSRSRWMLESRLRDEGLQLRAGLTMNGTEEVKKAVEANLGVGFVSRYSVMREVADGTLVRIPITGFVIERDFEVFWTKGDPLPSLAAPLLYMAQEYLAELAHEEDKERERTR